MAPTLAQRASLAAVIDQDLRSIERLDAELRRLAPALDQDRPLYEQLVAIGYLFHNLYNALENSFEQISRTFENHVIDPPRWHAELLGKMFLEIPGVRPAVLPASVRRLVRDLKGFRHLFRHAYDFDLDREKLARLVQDWQLAQPEVSRALADFRQALLR
jgi:hypothetical protein